MNRFKWIEDELSERKLSLYRPAERIYDIEKQVDILK